MTMKKSRNLYKILKSVANPKNKNPVSSTEPLRFLNKFADSS